MTRIAIITDSTCNIPDDMVKKYHIYIVAQHLIWGTEDLLDQKDITASQFYERLVKDPVHPKTAQPPAPEFTAQIEAARKGGADEILIITLSSEFSGTYASAVAAASEAKDIKVTVFNSRSVAMGLGWQVIAAARARDKGASLDELIKVADRTRQRTVVMLSLDTLDFLYKGGRIGGASRLVGAALDIKPRLVVDSEKGTVEVGERTRTRKKSIDATYRAFCDKLDSTRPLHIAVHDAKAPEERDVLVARFKADYPKAEIVYSELTPVLGTHGGPGTLGLCGYYEE